MKKCVLMFIAFVVAVSVAAILENNDIVMDAEGFLLDSEKQDSLFAHEIDDAFVVEN